MIDAHFQKYRTTCCWPACKRCFDCAPRLTGFRKPCGARRRLPTSGRNRLLSFAVGSQSLRVDPEAVLKRRRRSHRKRSRQRLASPRQNAEAITKEQARPLARRACSYWDNRRSGKLSIERFWKALMASADPCSEVRNDPVSDSKDQVANPLGGWKARSD